MILTGLVLLRQDIFEQYLLMEYLVYQMYNQISDHSFRTRLLKITYTDSAQKYEPVEKIPPGFLIEDEDMMAERLGGEINHIAPPP